MKIKLYQIAPEKDDKNLMFMSYEFTVLHGGINAGSYELVFDGDLPVQTAEDVFRIFNLEHPSGYDTSKDFLPQFEENSEKILNLMKMMPTSKDGVNHA